MVGLSSDLEGWRPLLSTTLVENSRVLLVMAAVLAVILVPLCVILHRRVAKLRNLYQATLDSLSEGVTVIGRKRGITHMNAAASRLLGIRDLMDYKGLESTFELYTSGGEVVPLDSWPLALAFGGQFLSNVEYRIRRKDTEIEVFTAISTAVARDRRGRTQEVVITYNDLTRPKQLDATRSWLAAIVESSEDAIVSKDLRSIVTSWNGGAEKIFGYTAAEMVGQSIKILLPPDHLYEEDEILARIGAGETVDHIETVRRKKNGNFIHVSLTISPIYDAHGKVVGASKIARNISDRKELESQLYQAQKMDAIGQLTGGIAHDFNNLLGVVIGNLDLLSRLVAGNELAENRVRTALKASARGADLTRRLLAFSSAGELRPATIRLEQPIQNTIELATRALGPEIEIRAKLDDSVPPIFADVAGLESALLNIIVNARDAMPRGGVINITTQTATVATREAAAYGGDLKPGRYAFLSISDTGSGMSREVLERAFEPFFTTKERGKGTGLGLAMVYGFAKQSHGTVRLYSEPGYGTTVSLYLPLAAAPEVHTEDGNQVLARDGDGSVVLLVDDEPELLEIAQVYLDEAGYKVLQARDSDSAKGMLGRHPEIELMVTDIIMPGGMNGAELALDVRHLFPNLKVIYCSGFPADALAERTTPLDGPFLRKPYDRHELVSMVRRTMGKSSA